MLVINAGSKKHEEILQKFGEFLEADSIEYFDYGDKEEYIIRKNNKAMSFKVSYNAVDGAFASFKELY